MKQHQTMRIESSIIQTLKKEAKKERRSLNNVIENALQDFVDSLKQKKS
jgi:predicted HicB family RNase H-like nuclease